MCVYIYIYIYTLICREIYCMYVWIYNTLIQRDILYVCIYIYIYIYIVQICRQLYIIYNYSLYYIYYCSYILLQLYINSQLCIDILCVYTYIYIYIYTHNAYCQSIRRRRADRVAALPVQKLTIWLPISLLTLWASESLTQA